MSHCSKAYIEFIKAFSDYTHTVYQWGDLEDEVFLWIIDIFMQYLGCKKYDYFNVETVFQGLNPNVFESLNIHDNERISLREAVDKNTTALFKDYNRLDKENLLKALSLICTIVSQNILNSEIGKLMLKNKDVIRIALLEQLGSNTYLNCLETKEFINLCNRFNCLELNV